MRKLLNRFRMYIFLLAAALAPSPSLKLPGANPIAAAPLESVVEATFAALADESALAEGRERDGSWCVQERVQVLEDAMSGLRGRKLAWWLDAPRPLRAVPSSGPRHEVSIVALPGASSLPAAAYPAGSIIIVKPLLGQINCRRLRLEANKPSLELMRRTMKYTDPCMNLFGGACHEWSGTAGVASAFLQVVLLGPSSRLPPTEGGETSADLVAGATMDCSVGDLLILERPTAAQLAWEADPSNGGGDKPDDAPELLRRLSSAVGGLDGPLAVIVRRGAGEHAVEPANSPHLPPLQCGTCCLVQPLESSTLTVCSLACSSHAARSARLAPLPSSPDP